MLRVFYYLSVKLTLISIGSRAVMDRTGRLRIVLTVERGRYIIGPVFQVQDSCISSAICRVAM